MRWGGMYGKDKDQLKSEVYQARNTESRKTYTKDKNFNTLYC